MPAVQNMALVALMLEEVLPGCVIEGVNYTDSNLPCQDALPTFLKQYEQLALAKEREEYEDLLDEDSGKQNKQIGDRKQR